MVGEAVSGRLKGRRLLLTGAASGIGEAVARLAAAEGAGLALLDNQGAKLRAVAEAASAHAIEVDLRDPQATVAAVEAAARALGGLDGLINGAGIVVNARLHELRYEAWQDILAINLTAPYVICRAALPWLTQAQGATIVNIASGQGLLPNVPGAGAYAASKGGLIAFSKSLAAELAPAIRVNAVCPGVVYTPMMASILGPRETANDSPFVAQYALKRVAAPEEIARAILFLTGPDSSYITGTAMAVDGGRTFH